MFKNAGEEAISRLAELELVIRIIEGVRLVGIAYVRIELRSPDPSCNPYLALAVMLKAGLDGIKRDLSCPDPVRENIYEFDEAKRAEYGIETLPGNLGEAIDALQADEVIPDALGDHVAEKFVEAKESEYTEYVAEVSEWELDRYLETF